MLKRADADWTGSKREGKPDEAAVLETAELAESSETRAALSRASSFHAVQMALAALTLILQT